MGKRQESDAQSVLDRVSSETSAIAAELRRYQLYAQAQSALGRMQATMGIDVVPSEVVSKGLDGLSAAIEQRLNVLDHGAGLVVADRAAQAVADRANQAVARK